MKKNNQKNIGIDAAQPENTCSSSKCPWHGHLKIRGRVFVGTVVSTKPMNTAIVEWNFYNFVPKYEGYERKKTRIVAHLPACVNAAKSDIVRISECRPISKSKKFVVIEKVII